MGSSGCESLFSCCEPQDFSILDCCFGPPKNKYLFDPSRKRSGGQRLSPTQIQVLLTNNQLGISVLVFFQLLIFSFWLCLSLIDGFALYDGVSGVSSHAHPVSHLGWWIVIELLVIIAGVAAVNFKLGTSKKRNTLELQVLSSVSYLKCIYMPILVIGILSNAVHAALTIVELSYCTSSFCRGFNVINPANSALLAASPRTSAFLIVFIVLLFVDIFVVQIWLIFRAYTYYTHLWYAVWGAKSVFDVETPEGPGAMSMTVYDENDPEQEPENEEMVREEQEEDSNQNTEAEDVESGESALSESLISHSIANTGIITPMMKKASALQQRHAVGRK